MSDKPETKEKREYRKGNPLTRAEIDRRLIESKKKSHRMIRTFVPIELADEFKRQCKLRGMTIQDALVEAILEYQSKHFSDNE